MEKNFKKNNLYVGLDRTSTNDIVINIASEYSRSNHKSKLWLNEEKFGDEVLTLWKSIATKKLLSLSVSFDEIDTYDSMTDIYEVPSFSISRGMRKAKISNREHGMIPKDWDICVQAVVEDTKTITPVLEVIKETLGNHLSAKYETELTKLIRPFLQNTEKSVGYYID